MSIQQEFTETALPLSLRAASPALQALPEDALAYLPVSNVTEYAKGQTIFGPARISINVFLVIVGKVGISRIGLNGSEVLLDIVLPDEVFGESAFVDSPCLSETATALETVRVMAWTISEIEDLVMQRPRLGVALLQIFAERNVECKRRIESFSLDTIERRLARSLLRFSERLGSRAEDGSVRMMPLTHAMLSRYVGTSRELITQYMNHFRRLGYMSYSRKGIAVYPDALRAALHRPGGVSAATGG